MKPKRNAGAVPMKSEGEKKERRRRKRRGGCEGTQCREVVLHLYMRRGRPAARRRGVPRREPPRVANDTASEAGVALAAALSEQQMRKDRSRVRLQGVADDAPGMLAAHAELT